jgi:hypothetical protein
MPVYIGEIQAQFSVANTLLLWPPQLGASDLLVMIPLVTAAFARKSISVIYGLNRSYATAKMRGVLEKLRFIAPLSASALAWIVGGIDIGGPEGTGPVHFDERLAAGPNTSTYARRLVGDLENGG